MKAWLVILPVALVVTTGCGSGGGEDAAATSIPSPPATEAVTSTTAPLATSTSRATGATSTTRTSGSTSTTAARTAATAIIEPAMVAGVALGANKSQAIAVLGTPTTSGRETDLSGKQYDFLRWQLDGNRGLTLNFRTESVTSPLLTDWTANASGPVTKGGVQVGDGAAKVIAAHGPLQGFCCESQVASVSQGGGRMIVVVDGATQRVTQITGGDPAFWSRSIAD